MPEFIKLGNNNLINIDKIADIEVNIQEYPYSHNSHSKHKIHITLDKNCTNTNGCNGCSRRITINYDTPDQLLKDLSHLKKYCINPDTTF